MSTNKQVRIIWHGHSCFEIHSEDGVIILDPYGEVRGYEPLDLEADLVLASHEHGDHNARDRVKLSGRSIDVNVEILATFHDDVEGQERGKNKIHIMTIAGKRIAHLGDLGHALSHEYEDQLQDLDVLMIPVGGHYTIDADVAAMVVKQTKPVITVPMHYREGETGLEIISTVEPFVNHFDNVTYHDSSSFIVGEYEAGILVLKNPMN